MGLLQAPSIEGLLTYFQHLGSINIASMPQYSSSRAYVNYSPLTNLTMSPPSPIEQSMSHGEQHNDGTLEQWNETTLPPVDYATMVSLAAEYVPGSDAEKKLLRKLDFRIIVGRQVFEHTLHFTNNIQALCVASLRDGIP
jgi:hypothetical protein